MNVEMEDGRSGDIGRAPSRRQQQSCRAVCTVLRASILMLAQQTTPDQRGPGHSVGQVDLCLHQRDNF